MAVVERVAGVGEHSFAPHPGGPHCARSHCPRGSLVKPDQLARSVVTRIPTSGLPFARQYHLVRSIPLGADNPESTPCPPCSRNKPQLRPIRSFVL